MKEQLNSGSKTVFSYNRKSGKFSSRKPERLDSPRMGSCFVRTVLLLGFLVVGVSFLLEPVMHFEPKFERRE